MNNINKQARIDAAEKFFNLLFGAVNDADKFGYLWTKQEKGEEIIKATYPFKVATPAARHDMAVKAIELNDAGDNVYIGVNLGDNPPADGKRYHKEQVTLQTATIADIDIEGGAHVSKADKVYPPNFDTARAFLPFKPSILVDSGFGLHPYCLYQEPITITTDNRQDCTKRNQNFISVIRSRAGVFSRAVDGVGDLSRVLRVPGTYNYKCGRENAPMCHVVEVNDVRFMPASLDDALKPFLPKPATLPRQEERKSARRTFSDGDEPTTLERLDAMLAVIPPADLSYDEWLNIGMAIHNEGGDVGIWEDWSRADERFKAGECERKFAGFTRNGLTIATIHEIAKRFGYSEKDFQREWHAERRQVTKSTRRHEPRQGGGYSAMHSTTDIIADIQNRCEWKRDNRGNRISIRPTQANLDLIFEEDPNLRGLVGYNQFQDTYSFLKKAPWHSDNNFAGGQWRDADTAELRGYIRRNYAELKDKEGIEDTVVHFANQNAFNPVKQYFYNLPRWDGKKRAENLFIKFLDADDTPQTREVTLNWLLAAVARIFRPGCRYQTALVLHGNQGIGKSYILERIGGQWYSAMVDNVSDPHALDALPNIWIGEFKEMAAMRKEDVNQIKSFLERGADNRRKPYERHATNTPRHCVFAVTVNDEGFLRDQTGNRRFLVVHCNRPKFSYVEGLTDEYIAQLWAEVFQIFNTELKDLNETGLGKRLELRPETKIAMELIAEKYVQDDDMTAEIKAHLEKSIPEQIIWKLLPKDARRKFFVDGKITIEEGDLDAMFKTKSGKITPQKQAEFDAAKVECESVRRVLKTTSDGQMPLFLTFYGREQRNHICAAEIYHECFANGDKRKQMYRIQEILSKLDGWQLGDRNELRRVDPEYPEQRKPYFRVQVADKPFDPTIDATAEFIDEDDLPI